MVRVSQARQAGRRDRYVCGRFAPVDKFDKTRNRSLLTGANRYSDRFIRRIRLVSPCGRSGSSATDIGFSITSALTEISRLHRARHRPSFFDDLSRLDRYPRSSYVPPFSVDLSHGNKVTEPWKSLQVGSKLVVKCGTR